MTKRAVSVTLHPDNLLWLRGQACALKGGSVSEVLDHILTLARQTGKVAPGSVRSVRGMGTIAKTDPELLTSDHAIRAMFETSLLSTHQQLHAIHPQRPPKRSSSPTEAVRKKWP